MNQLDAPEILSELHDRIDTFTIDLEGQDVGTVIEAGDGIARVAGLPAVLLPQLHL